jgi:hypothetical protein
LVIAVEVTFHCKVSKVGEGGNIRNGDAGVVLGKREVEPSILGPSTGFAGDGKVDRVVNEDGFIVVGLIGTMDDNISLYGRSPSAGGVGEELDQG